MHRSQNVICLTVGRALFSTTRLAALASRPTASKYTSFVSRRPGGVNRASDDRVVPAPVADRFVERREQPRVCRREHDEESVRRKVARCQDHLIGVALDVLQDIEIQECVKDPVRWKIRERPDDDLAPGRHLATRAERVDVAGKRGIGLETGPLSVESLRQHARRRAEPGPDLEDTWPQVRPHVPADVRLPADRMRECGELAALVDVARHDARRSVVPSTNHR